MSLVVNPAVQNLLFRQARSAKTFTAEPVTDEQIRAIYELVKYGPTSVNQQPLRIVLVRTPAARARLLAVMSQGNRAQTAAAPLTAILAADLNFHNHLPRLFPHQPGVRDRYADLDRRVASAVFNATLQAGYFIIGVRAAGLSAGPMTGFDAAALDKQFFGDRGHTALVVVNIGRPGPGAWLPRGPRLAYDEVVTSA